MLSSHTIGSTANLIIAAAGAGILSFPFAIERAGVVFGTTLCLVFAFFNILSLRIVARQATPSFAPESMPFLLEETVVSTPSSYVQLIDMKLGLRWSRVASASIYVGICGALIGYLIIMADLCCPVLRQWFSDSIISDRSVIIVVFVVCVIFPLSSMSHMESLAGSSLLAILSVLVVVLLVIGRSLEHLSHASYRLLPPTWWSVFEAMPIILFAFGCPLQVVPVAHEMQLKTTLPFLDTMYIVIRNTILFCCGMYFSVGLFGSLQFGHDTDGMILDNYSDTDNFANVARILMAVHIALAYPIVLYPAQQGLLGAIYRTDQTRDIPLVMRCVAALSVCVVTAGLAILLPQVEIVFGLVGSLVATTQVLVLPSMLGLRCENKETLNTIICSVLLFCGVLVGVTGTVIYVLDVGGIF